MEGCGNHRESFHESSLVGAEAQKVPKLVHILRDRLRRDDSNRFWVRLYSFGRDEVAEITGLLKQFTLLGTQLQSGSSQTDKHGLQIAHVLFDRRSSDNYIVQIDHANFGRHTAHYGLHKPLEYGRSIAKSKGHNF